MITRVVQRTPHDCGACALAMLLSVHYNIAAAAIKVHRPEADNTGCYYVDLIHAAADRGTPLGTWWRLDPFERNVKPDMPMVPSILDTEVSKGSFQSHFVYMDGDGVIYDPHAPRKEPRRLRDYKVWRSFYRKGQHE